MRLGAGGLGGRCVPLVPVPLQGFGGEEMDEVGTPVSASLRCFWGGEANSYAGEGIPQKISLQASGKGAYKMVRQKMEGGYRRRSNRCNGKNISCGWMPAGKMSFWGEIRLSA